ncbi:MAG: HK97 gp10 family phage protein [Lactobacillus sp.]|jgi:HK97 gp10 family phage protein|nr:HK97 gp10 family phage protein [Lactobacillus sp.]
MSVTGDAEILLNIQKLSDGYDRKARKAVRAGAKTFGDQLKGNTPRSNEDRTGKVPLAQDVKVGSVTISSGEYEAQVGYGTEKGPIAHFPNSGTSKQSPQHFVEETQEQARAAVLMDFIENLRVGDL